MRKGTLTFNTWMKYINRENKKNEKLIVSSRQIGVNTLLK